MATQPRTGRATWHRRANLVVLAYLVVGLVMLALRSVGVGSLWLTVHTFLLGGATNAIVIWTHHFGPTLLHPAAPLRFPEVFGLRLRTVLLVGANAAVVTILLGVSTGTRDLTIAAATTLVLVVIAHVVMLVHMLVAATQRRFSVTVWFYCAAGVALIVAVMLGAAMSTGTAPQWYERFVVAHVELNLLGWIALTVLGTEVSFWPMVLRTRIVTGTEAAARQSLIMCGAGLVVVLVGALAAAQVVVVVGLAGYLGGVVRSIDPFVRTAVQRTPHTTASRMLALASAWFAVGVVTNLVVAVRAVDFTELAHQLESFVPWLIAGFVVQVLLGALTYLIPVVLGRGPSGGRRAASWLDRFAAARLVGFNAGVALIALRLRQPFEAVGWSLVGLGVAGFVALALVAFGVTQRASAVLRD